MLSPFEQKQTMGERILRKSIDSPIVIDLSRGQSIADKQMIDDPLYLLCIEIDVGSPPCFKFEETIRLMIYIRQTL